MLSSFFFLKVVTVYFINYLFLEPFFYVCKFFFYTLGMIRKYIDLLLLAIGIFTSFSTLLRLAVFCSIYPSKNVTNFGGSFLNLLLIIQFIVVHSFFIESNCLNFARKCGAEAEIRPLYLILTSLSLNILMTYWNPITAHYLWKVEGNNCFYILHFVCWIIIICQNISWNSLEVLGVPQYNTKWRYHVSQGYLSSGTKNVVRRHRHVGLLPLFIIFW